MRKFVSPGSASIRLMLDFAARNQIAPVTEHFPMAQVNDAMEHLRAGKARYRIVLDRSGRRSESADWRHNERASAGLQDLARCLF